MGNKAFILTIITAALCSVPGACICVFDVYAAPTVAVTAPTAESGQHKDGSYEYGGLARRDPFAPLVSKREAGKDKGISPLETYDVNEIKVIAILWAKTKYYAVLSLPDGKAYTVTDGIKVGTRNGVISKIVKDSMVIKERVRDARGVMNPRDTVLRLRGEEEE